MNPPAGRVAVVTGAGRGIGAATARALAVAGFRVVVAARSRDQIERQRAELVRDGIRAALPPNPASLSRAIRDGKQSFEEAGGARAYFGFPGQATAEEGRATIELLGAILDEAVQAELGARSRQAQ